MDKFKKIADDIQAGWQNLSKNKKILLISLIVSVSISLALLVYFTQRVDYKVLFSELEEADAGAIVEDLEAKGMDYKLEKNGTTILIDEKAVDEYRINIAVDGPMPSKSTGFEIFDSSSLMATDDDRAIMYQRAITGELERAIGSIGNVNKAKVLLNLPENSVFQNPKFQKEASASVVLEMQSSQRPDTATVQGIVALVSGAIDNLPAEKVEVVDTNGNLLSSTFGHETNMSTDLVTSQQRIKKMIETDLEEQVLSLLGPVYGRDKVHISVNTDLNFDAIEREITQYGNSQDRDIDNNIIPYIRSQTESLTGSRELAETVQNSPLDNNTSAVFDEEDDLENTHYEHATNYELNSETTRIVEAPGAIERMTASVVIMDQPSDKEAIQGLVENALGMNIMRANSTLAADSVQVEFLVPGSDSNDSLVIGSSDIVETIVTWISNNLLIIGAGVLLLIILILIIRVIKKRRLENEENEGFEIEDESLMENEEIVEIEEEPVIDAALEEKMRLNEAASEKEDLVRQQSKENPELAAELIKIWLQDEEK